jgi:pimeloyl-ACP methyl ester carboxylesterase
VLSFPRFYLQPVRIAVFILFIPFGLLLPACNVIEMKERQAERAFRKSGLQARTFTDTAGAHFTWNAKGRGKPKLMLVHGITANAGMWAANVKELAQHFDLIIPDLIGHGHSTWKWSGLSVDAQVAHLDLILDSLHVSEPVFVVGNSYGGALAANFAEQHPDRVRKLVIYDGPANDYGSAVADSVARSVGAKDITDLFSPTNKCEQLRLLNMALYKPRKIPGFAMRQMNEHMTAHRGGHLPLLIDLLKNQDLYVHKVYRWPMPVYVIWGEGDRLIPPFIGRAIAKRNDLPADHLIIIPKAGHVANIEQPQVFNEQLLRILGEGTPP